MGTILVQNPALRRHASWRQVPQNAAPGRHILPHSGARFSGALMLAFSHLYRYSCGSMVVPKTWSQNWAHVKALFWYLALVQKTCPESGHKIGTTKVEAALSALILATHFLDQNTVSFFSSFLNLHFRSFPSWLGPILILSIRT